MEAGIGNIIKYLKKKCSLALSCGLSSHIYFDYYYGLWCIWKCILLFRRIACYVSNAKCENLCNSIRTMRHVANNNPFDSILLPLKIASQIIGLSDIRKQNILRKLNPSIFY